MDRTEQAKHVRRLMDELEEGAVAVATYTVVYRCPDCEISFVGSRKRRELLRHYVACHQDKLLVRWGRYAPVDEPRISDSTRDGMAARFGKVSRQPLLRELLHDYYDVPSDAKAHVEDRLLGEKFERWEGYWHGKQVLPDSVLDIITTRSGELETLEVAVQNIRIQLAAALSALAQPDPTPVAPPEPKPVPKVKPAASRPPRVKPKVDRAPVAVKSPKARNGEWLEVFREQIIEIAMEEVVWLSREWGAEIPRELAPKFVHLFHGAVVKKHKLRNKARFKNEFGRSPSRLGLWLNERPYTADEVPSAYKGSPSALIDAVEDLEVYLETLVPRVKDSTIETRCDGGTPRCDGSQPTQRTIVLDTETTGLPDSWPFRVVEVAVVDLATGETILDTRINPRVPGEDACSIPAAASQTLTSPIHHDPAEPPGSISAVGPR